MNIAIIYEYTDPEVWCTPLSLANGFRAAGHYVEQYPLVHNSAVYLDYSIDYDICIVMDWRGWDTNIVHQHVDDIMLVRECADMPQNFQRHLRVGLNKYDLLLSPDYDSTQALKEMGHHTVWFNHFADSTIHKPLSAEAVSKMSESPVRSTRGPGGSKFMDTLFSIMPTKFDNRNGLIGREYGLFLGEGKITVQNSRHQEVTRRIFEGMACGTMVLTDRLPDSTLIHQLFTEDQHIVYYNDMAECISKINYYLSPEGSSDRERIANNGYYEVMQYHTQKQRVEQILNEYNKWKG